MSKFGPSSIAAREVLTPARSPPITTAGTLRPDLLTLSSMRLHRTRLLAASLLLFIVAVTGAHAQTIYGSDYGGADLDPADGAILSGTFTNVGTFRVQAGRTVTIEQGTVLSVSAVSADIEGTINGVGSGYAGGARSGASSTGGAGSGPGGGAGGDYGGCVHGSGGAGGGYGATGGDGASHWGDPMPSVGGSAYGTAAGSDVDGGSGGGAGASHCDFPGTYGLAGPGGAGGGAIEIITTGSLDVSGAIVVDGQPGGDGETAPYAGAGGGGGAGGAIRLIGASGTITGTVSARGGVGGASGDSEGEWAPFAQPGGGGAGGRVKIASGICTSLATLYDCGGDPGEPGAFSTSSIPATAGGTGTLDGGTGCGGDPAGTPVECPSLSTSLTYATPADGACVAPGSTTTITWSSSGVTSVIVDVSTDGGGSWTTITTTDASTGTYDWNVPTDQTASTQTRLRLTSAEDATLTSQSGDFTVATAADIDLTSSREFLWSRTAEMFPITIGGASSGGCAPTVTLDAITATEDGIVVADLSADVVGADYATDDRDFSLRAVVTTGRGGRVYRIVYGVTDQGATTQHVVWIPVLPAGTGAFHGPEFLSPRVVLDEPSVTPLVEGTDLGFTLTATCAVRLWVETLSGQQVTRLVSDQLYPAGTYDIAWDGTNSAGAAMPDGAYLVQLKACGEKRVGVVIIERP